MESRAARNDLAIKTVFFDFGGTLAEQIADPLDVWVGVADSLSLGKSRDDLSRARDQADEWFWTRVFEYQGRTAEMWREYDRLVLHHLGIKDRDGKLIAAIQEQFDRVRWHRAYPESQSTLEAVRGRGYGLGVISDATDEVVGRLRELGLAQYFDAITYSQEAGANKPDRRIFQLALKRAGCAPSEALHVGNTYKEDVVGARSVGISPVLIDREDEMPDADCPRVRDLRGVLDLLSSGGKGTNN